MDLDKVKYMHLTDMILKLVKLFGDIKYLLQSGLQRQIALNMFCYRTTWINLPVYNYLFSGFTLNGIDL